jgi:uncharacterized protein (UPF0218 family)
MAIKIGKGLLLQDRMRAELAKPIDLVVDNSGLRAALPRSATICAIGDMTARTLLRYGYAPKIIVYDRKVMRRRVRFHKMYQELEGAIMIKNPSGTLTKELWDAVRIASGKRGRTFIEVIGEDDMAALACIHFARTGSFCVYGIPGRGMTVIHVTSVTRKKVDMLIKGLDRIK